MENEIKITVLNAQRVIKKDTGEVLTKVDYMTALEQTENFYGYSVLSAWCSDTAFKKCKDFLGKEVVAKIGIRKSKSNSLGAYIKSINGIEI